MNQPVVNELTMEAVRWWRVPMVWLVISGPMAVVVASAITMVVAFRNIDPLVDQKRPAQVQNLAEVVTVEDPKAPLAPAMQGRNHAATPAR